MFTHAERIVVSTLVVVAVVSGAFLTIRLLGYTFVQVPRSGGEYTEAIVGAPSLVNPLFAIANPTDADLARLVYAGLVRKDTQGNIVPDLAERFTVSTDQKTYTFRLRTNARWHDGVPVTADDIVFTLTRIQEPEMRSPLAQSFRGVGVEKIDDATVQITLREAFAPFIETLTMGILPLHLWGDVPAGTAQLAEYNVKPIGTGPFRFASFVKDKKGVVKSYTLERFDNYHGIRPYLQRITFRFYPTFDEANTALAQGEVQGIHFIPKRLRDNVAVAASQLQQLIFPQYTALFFNQQKNTVLKDKRVRQALMAAIDREQLIRDVFSGEATLIASPILPGTLGSTTTRTPPAFDPKKAEQLFTDAGWKIITKEDYKKKIERLRAQEQEKLAQKTEVKTMAPTTTPELRDVDRVAPKVETKTDAVPEPTTTEDQTLPYYREKGGETLTLRLTTIDHPENREVARIVKEAWEAIGVRVLLTVQKENFSSTVLQPRNYEVLLFGVVVGSDPDPFPFWHSSQAQAPGVNLALFNNREVDALLEDARRTNDVGIRENKYKRFQDILAEEMPADFLYTPTYTYLIGSTLKGFAIKNIAKPDDRFTNVQDWYIKTKWALKK